MEKKNNKKGKTLAEDKFESVGDEYIFLYEVIKTSPFASELENEEGKPPKIEYLRELYADIIRNKSLDEKYAGSKRYWFKEQEKAVIDYIENLDPVEKNLIFSKFLYKPLNKLIENIIFTYKLFRSDVDIKELQADCMGFLITKIDKFNPKTGAQAFSYLGTIAKHYLMGGKREAYKHTKSNADIDESIEEVSRKPENTYIIDGEESVDINIAVFEEIILKLEADIKRPKMLMNDKLVGEAIVYIFKNHHILEAYNKNRLYQLLKERTGLQTKDITYSLGRFKKDYEIFKTIFIQERE